MRNFQFISFIALFHGAWSLVKGERHGKTLEPRQDFVSTFYTTPLEDISITTKYKTQFAIKLNTSTLCSNVVIANYGAGGATLDDLLRDLDKPGADTTDFVLSAIIEVLDTAIEISHTCDKLASDDPALVTSTNTGTITVSLIKGDATSIVAGVGAVKSALKDPGPQLDEPAIAAGIVTGNVFVLNAVRDWIKEQGTLEKSDAVMLKLLAEWSRSTLAKAREEHIEQTYVCVQQGQLVQASHLGYLARFSVQKNPLYTQYGLLSGPELERRSVRERDNGDLSNCDF